MTEPLQLDAAGPDATLDVRNLDNHLLSSPSSSGRGLRVAVRRRGRLLAGGVFSRATHADVEASDGSSRGDVAVVWEHCRPGDEAADELPHCPETLAVRRAGATHFTQRRLPPRAGFVAAVAMNASGEVLLVVDDDLVLRARFIDPAGRLGVSRRIAAVHAATASAALADDGTAGIAWSSGPGPDDFGDDTGHHTVTSVYGITGRVGRRFGRRLVLSPSGVQGFDVGAARATATFVWRHGAPRRPLELFARRVVVGRRAGRRTLVASPSRRSLRDWDAAVTPDGGVFVAWVAHHRLFVRRRAAHSARFGHVERLPGSHFPTAAIVDHRVLPEAAIDPATGRPVVTWSTRAGLFTARRG